MTRALRSRGRHTSRSREAARRWRPVGICFGATALTLISVATAPWAAADTDDTLRAAVVGVRPSSCPPLQSEPVIDQAAVEINETTDRWINFAARAVPATDAVPLLQDLGYPVSKAKILSGAAHSSADSIKAMLLQGFNVLPDCSYTHFGVGSMYNAKKDVVLVTVVLTA